MVFLRDSFRLSAAAISLSQQPHGILDFAYCPFVVRFACDAGQSAKVWIYVFSEAITISI